MKTTVYNKILSKLTPELQEQLKLHLSPSLTQSQTKKSFSKRLTVTSHVRKIEAIYPNENFSANDIAFGILANGKFVSALDFQTEIEKGYISHSSMLVGLGYAKNEDDPKPKYDYVVRGIVKAALNGNVVFWETPEQLLEKATLWKAFQKCLQHLLKLGTVSKNAKVFGSGKDVPLGEVLELI
jgi:hypothetical protein